MVSWCWRGSTLYGDDRGLATLSEALLRNPNAAWAYGVKGMLLVQVGRYSEGREAVRAAERLNPRDPSAALFPAHLAISYYFERNYPCAVATARNVLARYPNYPIAHRFLAASLGQTRAGRRGTRGTSKGNASLAACFYALGPQASPGFDQQIMTTCWTGCERPAGRADIGRG
jgi:tetratricopeptide (TPR) repeat protein